MQCAAQDTMRRTMPCGRRPCGPTSCCGAAGQLFTHRFRIFATLRLLLVDSHILELLPLWFDVTFGSDSDTLFDTQVFFLLIGCDPNGWFDGVDVVGVGACF